MTTVDRISVFYEVNDTQAKQAFNSLAQASATTNAKMIQNAEKFEASVKRQAQTVKTAANDMKTNVGGIAALEGVEELHIGHAIVARSVFTGLREAVREMKALCSRSR